MSVESVADDLIRNFATYESCVVAFSAGVDSSVVAKAAFLALKDRALAVTAVSPSLASGELEAARRIAGEIGISHQEIRTEEVTQPAYRRNDRDRCYHCKSELYRQLAVVVNAFPNSQIVNGSNTDDLGDYRPGLTAAAENEIRSPLVECGINKVQVRELAQFWKLSCWDKPAMPCLSSRLAYGVEVTPERLRMVDQAEQFLKVQGFKVLRVRYHEGDLARIEVPQKDLPELLKVSSKVTAEFVRLGFRFVTMDLEGFRSGNLNQLISVDSLRASSE